MQLCPLSAGGRHDTEERRHDRDRLGREHTLLGDGLQRRHPLPREGRPGTVNTPSTETKYEGVFQIDGFLFKKCGFCADWFLTFWSFISNVIVMRMPIQRAEIEDPLIHLQGQTVRGHLPFADDCF